MLGGQFYPGQRFQFGSGDLSPVALGVSSLTFRAAANGSASDTCSLPTGSAIGDLAVLFDMAKNDSTTIPTEVTPSGWTQALASTGLSQGAISGSMRQVVSYKVLTNADITAGSVTGMTANDRVKRMLAFIPDASITTVTPGSWNQELTSGDPASQTVTASGQQTPLVVFGMIFDNNAAPAFSTESPAFDATGTVTDGCGIRVGYKVYNSSPSNHSVDMNDEGGGNALVSGYLRVA